MREKFHTRSSHMFIRYVYLRINTSAMYIYIFLAHHLFLSLLVFFFFFFFQCLGYIGALFFPHNLGTPKAQPVG